MNKAQATPQTHTPPTIPLTAYLLRFTCRVTEPIHLPAFSGSSLRGAFANHLRRTFCPEWRAAETDPTHRLRCPACYMLTLDGAALDAAEEARSGDIRRPWALRPPMHSQATTYPAGSTLRFDMTLFGRNLAFLPYLVLTVAGMGEGQGVGFKDPQTRRRGRYQLEAIHALHPFTGQEETILAPDSREVRMPTLAVTDRDVRTASAALAAYLADRDNRLALHLRTPVRLYSRGQILRRLEPFALLKHAARRLLDLAAQHGEGRPQGVHLRTHLYPYADSVQIPADETQWWDVQGHSSRLGRRQPLGGLVGRVVLQAPNWEPLLPWLLWGSVIQVGKNIVKGCGWYDVEGPWPLSNT